MVFYKIKKYGEFNNYDLFKIIAFIIMFIDHLGLFIFPDAFYLRLIGRIAFPMFAILHGITFKKNKNSLLFFGTATAITLTSVFHNILPLNILFSFFITGLFFNTVDDWYKKSTLCPIILILLAIPSNIILKMVIEYGIFSLLFMLVGKNFKKIDTNLLDVCFNIMVFILYLLVQINNFGFNLDYSIIFAILLLITYLSLKKFEFREYFNIKTNKFLVFISRHTMELYFFHILILVIIFKTMH